MRKSPLLLKPSSLPLALAKTDVLQLSDMSPAGSIGPGLSTRPTASISGYGV
jgi:hypothetical protein